MVITAADNLRVSPRELENFLFMLKNGPVKQIELQRQIGFPSSVMRNIPLELSDIVLREGDRLSLSPNGKGTIEQIYSSRLKTDAYLANNLANALKELRLIELSRPRSKREFDQFRALPETVVQKVEMMYRNGELEGRKIILIGDDDLVSVAVGLTGLAKRVTTLDIDKDLLSLIQALNTKYAMNIETVHYDAKKRLPDELKSKYDVAVTDPPYTPNGIALFVSRSVECIERSNGVIYLAFGYSSRATERALPIQGLLTQMGLVMEQVLPKFVKYYAAQSIGSSSSLYVCRLTPQTKPIFRGEFKGEIYTRPRE